MGKKQSTIYRLLMATAIGESLAVLPQRQRDIAIDNHDSGYYDLHWGANTSMTLATVTSLSKGYQLQDVMQQIQAWSQKRRYAATGMPPLADRATQLALQRFAKTKDPLVIGQTDQTATSHHVLVRMLPITLYLSHQFGRDFVNDESAMLLLHRVAGLTHNCETTLVSVGILSLIFSQLLEAETLFDAVENGLAVGFEYYARHHVFAPKLTHFQALNLPDFAHSQLPPQPVDQRADTTLIAVLWLLLNTTTYHEAVTRALAYSPDQPVIPTLVSALAAVFYQENHWLANHASHMVDAPFIKRIATQAERLGRFV